VEGVEGRELGNVCGGTHDEGGNENDGLVHLII
jgi:hypothetical protein